MSARPSASLAVGAKRVPSHKVALMAHLLALVAQLSRSQTQNGMMEQDLVEIGEIQRALHEIQGLLRQITGEDPDVE